jgi:TonB family protein
MEEEIPPPPDEEESEEAPEEQPEPDAEPEPEEDTEESPPEEESEAVTVAPEPEESPAEEPVEQPEEPKPKPPAKPQHSTTQPEPEAPRRSGTRSSEGSGERGTGPAARAGAPGGTGFRLDSAFPYPWYLELVQRRLSEGWLKPAGARPTRPVVIYFRVLPEGRLGLVEVESSSGMPMFDRSALRAVKTLDRLPPLPRGFREAYLGVHCEFLP